MDSFTHYHSHSLTDSLITIDLGGVPSEAQTGSCRGETEKGGGAHKNGEREEGKGR